MSEINIEFWDKEFECQADENVDQDTLLQLIEVVRNMKKDLTLMQQEFEKMYKINFQTRIEQEKPKEGMSEEVQHKAACTSAMQKNTETVKTKAKQFYDNIAKIFVKNFKRMNLKGRSRTYNVLSESDDENIELTRDNKHFWFDEIMYQDEIKIVNQQIENSYRFYSMKTKVWIPKQIETFIQRIHLASYVLELEEEVLHFKLQKDLERMTRDIKTCDEMNLSSEVDEEKSEIMIDINYIRFVETTRQKEINRFIVQLQIYCDKYNMPDEEVKIAKHRDLIMRRIEMLKGCLNLEVIDFDLQIGKESTYMETKDTEASDMPSNVDNVKNTLMKSNKCLRYIVMEHQKVIDRVYAQLQTQCNKDKIAIKKKTIVAHPNVGADEIEKTNIPSEIDEKSGLWQSNEYFRSVRDLYQEQFIPIFYQLQMYNSNYDKSNENVTIVMHTEPYDPTKTNDEENELKMENEYLAFVAMMHLEKIKEICAFFEMYRHRFVDRFETKVTEVLNSTRQTPTYLNDEIFVTEYHVFKLMENLDTLKNLFFD